MGDYSTPGEDTKDNIFEILSIENSPLGAINVYLLYRAWHYLPLFWHANYEHYDYVYTQEDISADGLVIYEEKRKDKIVNSLKQFDVTPIVVQSGERYYVSCCYWCTFKGLIREVVEIEIRENKVTDIFDVTQTTLYKYCSSILF